MLTELFALPIALKQVIEIDGIPLYGNQVLNDKLIQSVKLSRRGKIISKSIEKLVRDGIVVPCFADPGILSYFRRRVSNDTSGGLLRILRFIFAGKKPIEHPLDWCLAFYHFGTGKIVILVSNHITEKFSMTASNESISLALLHELMHFYAHKNPNKFLSFFKDELTNFYKNYFSIIFKFKSDIDVTDLEQKIQSFYKTLFLRCEMSSDVSLMLIYKQLKKFQQFSEMSEEEFKTTSFDYLRLTRLLLSGDMQKVLSLTKVKYKYLVKPLYSSYTTSFGKIPQKGCIQEIILPSEVISGFTDIGISPKVKTAIQSLLL